MAWLRGAPAAPGAALSLPQHSGPVLRGAPPVRRIRCGGRPRLRPPATTGRRSGAPVRRDAAPPGRCARAPRRSPRRIPRPAARTTRPGLVPEGTFRFGSPRLDGSTRVGSRRAPVWLRSGCRPRTGRPVRAGLAIGPGVLPTSYRPSDRMKPRCVQGARRGGSQATTAPCFLHAPRRVPGWS